MMMMSLTALYVLSLWFVVAVQGLGTPNWFNDYVNKCKAERSEPWSYSGFNGPKYWGVRYPNCYGRQQSPINIVTADAVEDENLEKLTFNNYDQPLSQGKILNNGHTVQVNVEDDTSRTISVNGEEYSLRQFHFHWGDNYDKGSEHTLDKTQYAMEIHFVHMNANNQIAVVGAFFQEQDNDNEKLQALVDELQNVPYKGDERALQSNINFNDLLPENTASYYRYQGSLTTPGCSEGVVWSVIPDLIPVGRNQMDQFRKLYSVKKSEANDNCRLVNNFRPVQPLNGRKVSVSK